MLRILILFCLLSVFWLFNSGSEHFNVLMLSLGAVSVSLVLILSHRMDLLNYEAKVIHFSAKLPLYYLWLIKEIILANVHVVRCILSRKPSISPTLISIKASQRSAMAKVIYANSITLTPGTVTIDINEDEFIVHALTFNTAQALKSGIMDQKVSALEK